jgi:ABC-2 type transport system ATP-binding protein
MIEVKNLSKKYGDFQAVRDVSFSLGRDQVLGFLGPNGAGKTTIMKILTGYHFPSGGQAVIDGISVEESPIEIKKRIGYLPESNPLYGDMSPEEYLNFAASARLMPKEAIRKAVDDAIAACGLEGERNHRIESLSKGYKQRVGLAQAIIHDPPILILDEPTSGLDPNQIIEIRSLITELGKRKTVILSTHILQEVEAVCSQVLILNEGRIAAQGTPDEIAKTIRAGGGMDTWELCLKGAAQAEIESRLRQLGRETGEVKAETLEDGIIRLGFVIKNSAAYALDGECIFDWAIRQGYKIIGMNRKKLSLEDIFVKLTAEERSSQTTTEEDRG